MSELEKNIESPWRASVVMDFTRSELFTKIFDEGMELVELTAAYLDGTGRQESRRLSRQAAVTYASESMRLTTRLMQVASWLLVQRAIKEDNMTASAACEDRYRLRDGPEDGPQDGADELPPAMIDLIDRSRRLHARIMHLDRRMYVDQSMEDQPHPVLSQHEKLMAAFGR
jgi:regulator of CtrA degradation